MKTIWIVNNTTGLIEGSGAVGDDTDVTQLTTENTTVIETPPNNDSQIWQQGQWIDRPPQPSFNHQWVNGSWQLNLEFAASTIRQQRDRLLAKTDWTQGRDILETVSQKYVDYRQQLRDITSQPGFPEQVIWPTPPSQ
jgi:hypothetical protein